MSKEPMSDYKPSFVTPGTCVTDGKKKCPQGASKVHVHVNSIAHPPSPFGKLEEFTYNKKVSDMDQQYLELIVQSSQG